IADRAYHSNEIRQHIQGISSEAVIPCKSNTLNHIPFDSHVYKGGIIQLFPFYTKI
ncbi:hypothetical protein IBF26_09305, partial [Francisella tularensis]|nr:hypothetical protein [Francisella tularensis]MBK2129734.1 hypothetical protein [Francisella tularensis]MBK2134603.1 hypothetical protein [Francisella tularensis]MBK2136269.1 hypothetical protein [Francisella tularensis]MBK2137941.1 hypothetical protein [Francisella tularensis]